MSKISNISLAVCGLVLSAGASLAQDMPFTQGEMDSFVAALITVDCRVDSETAVQVEEMTGFSDGQLEVLVEQLLKDGSVVRSDDGEALELKNEGCP